ncbi:transmembrane ascorbate-dependent reductase CYB561-like [Liolophura sinensis]|uniref:transmembrane ascorbate-dependent reductase CYB561-like n=1 Tax=Liolophura sinensis TaxID=3198878 RepID=UPI003159423F
MESYGLHGDQQRNLRWFTWLVLLAQLLGLTAVILVAVWMGHFRSGFAWQENPAIEFNYHPLFMIIGMIFLYADAMLVYRVFRNDRKIYVKILHGSLHVAALLFSAVGLKAVFDSHNLADPPKANLYSLHSWMGLITIILFGLQWLGGFLSFLWPGASLGIRKQYMPFHTFWGLTIFCMAVGTALMGIVEKTLFSIMKQYSSMPSEGLLINFLGLTIVALAITVVYIVTKSEYKREPTPDEEHIQLAE